MIYAEIKKTSRRAAQRSYHMNDRGKCEPFPVEINSDGCSFGQGAVKGGIGGNYELKDVILYIKNDDGKFIKIK